MPYFQFEGIKLGFLTLHAWGFFVSLGFLTGLFLLLRSVKKDKIAKPTIIVEGFIWIIIGVMIFARIDKGFASLGGIIGGIVSALVYFKVKRLSFFLFLKLADLSAPAIALGLAVGRIGCFLIKDHPGKETSLPWGIIWPDGMIRHPVALYLIINALIIFFLLRFLKSRFEKPGQIFFIFMAVYFLSRFLLDFTRNYQTQFEYLYHWFFLIGFIFWFLILFLYRKGFVAKK